MLLGLLERFAARRRRQGDRSLWTAITLAAFLLRVYRRRADKDEVSLREELRPGESLLISHTTSPRG